MPRHISLTHDNPTFVVRKSCGAFPKDLTFGFEAEMFSTSGYKQPNRYGDYHYGINLSQDKALHKLQKKWRNFFVFKYDTSIYKGMELVSHPFNWNWFLSNPQMLNDVGQLSKHNFKGGVDAGFHVHIGREFFTYAHLKKMAQFYYRNPEFILKVSKRTPDELMDWANPWYYDQDSLSRILDCGGDNAKGMALNLKPDDTIEVRIFRSTTNKELIRAYLEFVMASVMFTKVTPLYKITDATFLQWLKDNQNKYPNALLLATHPRSRKLKL